MKVNEIPYRTLWVKEGDPHTLQLIDQRWLPHQFVIEEVGALEEMVVAIREMHLRGAPLIGVAAAFGMYLSLLKAAPDRSLGNVMEEAAAKLKATRPTAVNLTWAVERQLAAVEGVTSKVKAIQILFESAKHLADENVSVCQKIGEHGLRLLREISEKKRAKPLNILTHCNAGWLACVDWGTATAPIYRAFDEGITLHVWVTETRPRNQGASLTAWELEQQKIPYTVVVDNAAGHLMRTQKVDLVLVGTDRTTAAGDVANKIGTYLLALAARENAVPFYAAVPSASIDWTLKSGEDIVIEERGAEEVAYVHGLCDGSLRKVRITPEGAAVVNYAFDVTPAKLVTGLITERGTCPASEQGLKKLFA